MDFLNDSISCCFNPVNFEDLADIVSINIIEVDERIAKVKQSPQIPTFNVHDVAICRKLVSDEAPGNATYLLQHE
eukprot:XP_001708868.1 Hypothetical protein GL50803_32426 [Giardia lamblia ATCC 50803]